MMVLVVLIVVEPLGERLIMPGSQTDGHSHNVADGVIWAPPFETNSPIVDNGGHFPGVHSVFLIFVMFFVAPLFRSFEFLSSRVAIPASVRNSPPTMPPRA